LNEWGEGEAHLILFFSFALNVPFPLNLVKHQFVAIKTELPAGHTLTDPINWDKLELNYLISIYPNHSNNGTLNCSAKERIWPQ